MRVPRPSPGFTLIEAIVAIVILSLAIPAIQYGITQAHHRRFAPVLFERARWLAAEKLEDIIGDRHGAGRGYAYVISANYSAEASIPGFVGYSRSVTVTETSVALSGVGTGYKTVVVTVTFPASADVMRTYSLATVLTEYTP